jgi:GT2 family glycosyltransferase
MNRTLIILPKGSPNTPPDVAREVQELFPESTLFYQDNANVLDLKKILCGNGFETIVVVYRELKGEFSEIQVVRSLAPQCHVVLFCPDMGFIERPVACHASEDSDYVKWYKLGRTIQLNACRDADMIITESDEEREILLKEIPNAPVQTLSQFKASPALPEKRKTGKVSIIMLTFNQLEDTRQTVESLLKYTHSDYELICVDNGSVDQTREYLEKLQKTEKHVRVILNEKNVGFAKANNQGMKIATGEYILLLNNDVILTEGWLERMLVCVESDPLIGVVGPVTNHAVGQQVVEFPLDVDVPNVQKFACMQVMQYAGYWFETHRIIGFCLLVKKEVIEKIGMLDERFGPGGFEDYDFCLRVKQAGYRIMIMKDVFVYHMGGRGYSKNNLDYDQLRHQNVQIFIEKWCRKALEIMEHMPN